MGRGGVVLGGWKGGRVGETKEGRGRKREGGKGEKEGRREGGKRGKGRTVNYAKILRNYMVCHITIGRRNDLLSLMSQNLTVPSSCLQKCKPECLVKKLISNCRMRQLHLMQM